MRDMKLGAWKAYSCWFADSFKGSIGRRFGKCRTQADVWLKYAWQCNNVYLCGHDVLWTTHRLGVCKFVYDIEANA